MNGRPFSLRPDPAARSPAARSGCARVAAAALLWLAGLVVPASAAAQLGSSHWRPDQRVLIGDFSWVEAMARGPDRVYAATGGGLVVYDELARAFELPLTLEDGWPESPVRALAYDDRDGTVWMATADGRLLQLQPDTRRFQSELRIGEEVVEIVPAEVSGSDLFLQTREGWVRFDAFLREASPADPRRVRQEADRSPDLRARAEILRDPGFQTFAPFLGGTAGSRAGRVTDVVAARGGGRYWVGTAGAFLVEYDHLSRTWEPLAYGVLGRGVAALAADGEGVWFLPRESAAGRFGVARADAELQRWQQWPTDSVREAPREPLRAALSTGGRVWAGGASGLYRYAGEREGWREARDVELPSREVTALAASPEGDVWVGTTRGAALLSPAGEALGREAVPGRYVDALAWHDGRLWIATRDGLFVLGEMGAELAAGPLGPLRRPARALASDGGRLYAGLGEEVWSLEADAGWRRIEAVGPVGAPVTALAVADGVLWVGSDEGIVVWDSGASDLRRYTFAAGDLPTERGRRGVHGFLPAGPRRAWAATPAGALRIEAE